MPNIPHSCIQETVVRAGNAARKNSHALYKATPLVAVPCVSQRSSRVSACKGIDAEAVTMFCDSQSLPYALDLFSCRNCKCHFPSLSFHITYLSSILFRLPSFPPSLAFFPFLLPHSLCPFHYLSSSLVPTAPCSRSAALTPCGNDG